MTIVIVASNVAVMVPINDWLTWGAFTYPFVFLVTDLTNRAVGPQGARKVAWVGLVFAVVLSVYFASWQIALASGTAFISAQLLDISLFNRLRAMSWWKAPLIGSIAASVVDTGIFFFIAFYGSDMNWLMLASGDLMVKWAMAAALLLPYRLLLPRVAAIAQRTATPAV
ncbi:VUT family protein [Burkholderiaceae bacterium]|nr:VUT family protein [Burkholderiaceae bacterium]